MKINPAITMWKALNADHIRHTVTCLEPEECDEMADDAEYHPVDSETCVIVTDECAFLAKRSGLAIVNMMEFNWCLLEKMK